MRRRSIVIGKASRPCRRADQARSRAIAACRKLSNVRARSGDGHGLEQAARRGRAAVALLDAMLDDGRKHRLHVLRNHGAAPGDQCPGARRAQQADRGARRRARRSSPAALRVCATSACT